MFLEKHVGKKEFTGLGKMFFFFSPYRTWMEYKHGFGNLLSDDGEFWLGNDPLHYLTSQGRRYKNTDGQSFFLLFFFRVINFDSEPIFFISFTGKYKLKIKMKDFDGIPRFAEYKDVKVGDEKV